MTRAFICPGQGSQFIGMGKDLAENFTVAKEVFQEVDEALSQHLSAIMFDGEADDLNMTENTQPALMAHSVAVARILESEGGFKLADKATAAAGHSLGEYSALTIMGALTLADSAKLLKLRGQAMQRAVPVGLGAMAAILGLEFDDVAAVVAEVSGEKICAIGNDNCPGQIVISGHKEAVEKAAELAKDKGAKRAVMLPVSAPFHCPLMQPAANEMRDALADINVSTPALPIIANVTTEPVTDPDTIKDLLVQQVTGMVRWNESITKMGENGTDEMIELGAGKVLSGLVRKINRDMACSSVGTVNDIEEILKIL